MASLELLGERLKWRHARTFLFIILGTFGTITALRADQWRDYNSFYRYEALHHPLSPRIQLGLSILLEAQGQYTEATAAVRRAIELQPTEAGNFLLLYLILARQGQLPTTEEQQKVIDLLKTTPLSASTFLALQHTVNCLQTWCRSLQQPLEFWANTVLARPEAHDKSYYYYLLGMSSIAQGKNSAAIRSLALSHEADPTFMHPLFALASIYVQLSELRNAELILAELERVNVRVSHRRDNEIETVRRDIDELRLKRQNPLQQRRP